MREHILSIDGLGVSYRGARAVTGLTLSVGAGEIVGLVGESGSGKTTVLRAVAGLLAGGGKVVEGTIRFCGRDLASLTKREMQGLRGAGIAYVFQDPSASLDPLVTLQSQFDECIRTHRDIEPHAMRELEVKLLDDMGFDDPERALSLYPHNLSGGMCQRAVLAFALACEPKLLLADEPTSALDAVAQLQVIEQLQRIREERGTAILMVSHNMGAVARLADRIGIMLDGELVEMGETRHVLDAPQHPYTRDLIAAIPPTDGTLPRVPDSRGGAL